MQQTKCRWFQSGVRAATVLALFVMPWLTSLALSLAGSSAWSQTVRSIRMIVPIGPGSGLDIMARLVAEQVSRTQGVAAVVENRPGGTQIIATEAVAGAAPDGSTVLFMASPFIINPHLRRVSYDPITSFEPICNLASQPQLIVVSRSSPYRSLADLINAARAKPGELTLASFGPASPVHIAFEMLKRTARVDMTFVSYSSTPAAMNAVLGDHVTSAIIGYAEALEQLKAGALRALATGAQTRVEALPDVPTLAEAGYKDAEIDLWFGAVAPAKTTKETVARLASWFTTAMQVPQVKAKLATQAFQPVGVCGADFGAFLRAQYENYGRVIREANIKAE